jgi:hypothetical protein
MSPSSATLLAVACAVFIASASAMPLHGGSTCAILSGSLPQFCTCTDGSDSSASLVCSINPMSLDQMSFTGVVQPCNASGATIDLSVKDTKFNVSYAFPQFAANTNGSVPVPGEHACDRAPDSFAPALTCSATDISLTTPFGNAGVYANYNISGDASAITFGLTVDLCVVSTFYTTCAGKLGVPGMPVTLIQGTYDFSSLCS